MKLSGLFVIGDHLKRLSETGDPLETLNAIIDFEAFRPVLLTGVTYADGHPPRQRMTDEERAVVREGGEAGKFMAEIAAPLFGYKSHIGIDQRHGFIRTCSVSHVARYEGRELAGLIDRTNIGSAIWADMAYRSQKNECATQRAGLVSKIHFRRAPGKLLPDQRQRANAACSKVSSVVEHVFATQKHRMGLFIRTIGMEMGENKDQPRQYRVQLQMLPLLGMSAELGMMHAAPR